MATLGSWTLGTSTLGSGGGGGGGASTTPAPATASVTVVAPTVTYGATRAPAPASVSATVVAPAVTSGAVRTVTAASVSATAVAPSVQLGAVRTPSPATATVDTPAPTVTGGGANASGFALPTGDLTTNGIDWDHKFATDFDTDVALGSWPASDPDAQWFDTYEPPSDDTENDGFYDSSRTISVSDSTLKVRMHTDGGVTYVGAPIVRGEAGQAWSGQTYGRFEVAMRAVHEAGPNDASFKTAFLLWPVDDVWPDHGEIDFPEGSLEAGATPYAAHLYARPEGGWDTYPLPDSVNFSDWHVYTIEWSPNRVAFYYDGIHVGTSTLHVPTGPMRWVLQCETNTDGLNPDPTVVDQVEVDWVAKWDHVPVPALVTPEPATVSASVAAPAVRVGSTVGTTAAAASAVAVAPSVTGGGRHEALAATVTVTVPNAVVTGDGSAGVNLPPVSIVVAAIDPTVTAFMPVYHFSPPGRLEKTGARHPLFARMSIVRGVSLLKKDGIYSQVRMPSDDQITDADIAYLGGYLYEVSAGEAAALSAAGYGEWVSSDA